MADKLPDKKLPPIGLVLVEKRISDLACQLNEFGPDNPRRQALVDEMKRLVEISVELKMNQSTH
jgi:hypothetical protein